MTYSMREKRVKIFTTLLKMSQLQNEKFIYLFRESKGKRESFPTVFGLLSPTPLAAIQSTKHDDKDC